jgi:hypothetical protein
MSRARSFPIGLALVVVAALVVASGPSASHGQETPIVVRVEDGGFHWSDAAIGALAGVGISLAATGCVALVRLRDAGNTTRTKGEQQ